MSIVGKWKFKYVMTRDNNLDIAWVNEEKYQGMKRPFENEDEFSLFESYAIFAEDGILRMAAPLPKNISRDKINAAVNDGIINLYDGMWLTDKSVPWKEENGKVYTSSYTDKNNQPVWNELNQVDGMIEILFGRYSKVCS